MKGRREKEMSASSSTQKLVVSPSEAQRMLDVGTTYFYRELLPVLETYMEGRQRKITVRSIQKLIEQRLADRIRTSGKIASPRRGKIRGAE
jgi:hypothetical protein